VRGGEEASCDIGKVVSAVRRLRCLASLFCKSPEMGPSRIISPVIAALTNLSNPLLFLVSGRLSAQSFELVS